MIQTSREIAALAGEPRATIRVRNLQTNIKIGRDAWGRAEKVQPVLISASVSLRQSFETASEQDTVNASTIHYGTLSKAILEAAGYFNATTRLTTSRQFLDYLMGHLTSYTFDGKENANPTSVNDWTPVLDTSMIRSLELKITLPKASLLGTGVSLVGSCWYSDWKIQNGDPDNYSMELTLQGLRIPTLIGVNPNERLAKQIVVADIKIDQWTTEKDTYPELEEVVVKTIEESSFQTLEALANHVGWRLVQYFIIPEWRQIERDDEIRNAGVNFPGQPHYPRINICLKKPTAVTLADAPEVEILLDCHSDRDKSLTPWIQTLWDVKNVSRPPPFPLQGRLDDYIQEEQDCKNGTAAKKRSHDSVS